MLTAILAWSAGAHAQTLGDEEARHRHEAGTRAYEQGRFAQALEDWTAAYELSGRPQLLNNIAEAHERLRHDRQAIEYFERFLHECRPPRCEVPPHTRVRVQNRVAALRAAEPREAAPSDAPAPAPSGADPGPGPWIAAGASVAVAAVGAILVGVAVSDVAAIDNAPQDSLWADYEDAYGRTEAMSIAGFVMLGVGAASLTAALFWLIAGPELGTTAHLDLHIAPDAVALRMRGSL